MLNPSRTNTPRDRDERQQFDRVPSVRTSLSCGTAIALCFYVSLITYYTFTYVNGVSNPQGVPIVVWGGLIACTAVGVLISGMLLLVPEIRRRWILSRDAHSELIAAVSRREPGELPDFLKRRDSPEQKR